jgi:transposase
MGGKPRNQDPQAAVGSDPGCEGFERVHPNAAGLDIGSAEIWVSVPADRAPQPVRTFGTFTPDLEALAEWLKACGIDTVAMESTGVYWIPVYEILEERGLQACLVNARHVKNVPGRKTDRLDCRWIRRLHTYGLLNASFRPEAERVALRAYLRHRARLLEHRAAPIQQMQKALLQMNVQLTQVLSDITGTTGLAIIRAIVAGERDPVQLAQLRQRQCHRSEDQIARALTGHYRQEHVFALHQALALYDFYTQQVQECDAEIERQFTAIKPEWEAPLPPLEGGDKRNSHSKNAPAYDARSLLYQVTGVDLVAITGLNEITVETILSEVGLDLNAWPTEKHFCSGLGLAPHNDISGGKVLRSRTLPTHNRAGQAFRLAAQAVSRSDHEFGAFYRRMKARLGPEKAMVATAHKIARTFYHGLKHREAFQSTSAAEYEQRFREREIANLKRKAAKLGLTLMSAPA